MTTYLEKIKPPVFTGGFLLARFTIRSQYPQTFTSPANWFYRPGLWLR